VRAEGARAAGHCHEKTIFQRCFGHVGLPCLVQTRLHEGIMQSIIGGYRGLSVLVDLNRDRLFFLCAMGGALFAAAYIAN